MKQERAYMKQESAYMKEKSVYMKQENFYREENCLYFEENGGLVIIPCRFLKRTFRYKQKSASFALLARKQKLFAADYECIMRR